MNNMLNGMFGKIAPGMCRLSMNGGIAVKTSNGYKSYNIKTGRLANCDSFVFNIGEEFFFVIPTNKAEPGDILLVGGKPKCVVEAENELKNVQEYFKALWESVKQNVDAEWCGENIKIASVNLACEAIQVAAMAQKFIDSQKEREKREGN